MKEHTARPFAKPNARSPATQRPGPATSENDVVVAFPSKYTSVPRDMAQVGGNLRDLAAAVHSSFLATFATIPQSLLAAATELVADRRRDELAARWRATLRLYVESLETGLVVVDIVARAHGVQWLGLATTDSIRRISALVLGEFITASHRVDSDAEMSSLLGQLGVEVGHFTELLAELRRKTCGHPKDWQETNSAP